MKRVNCFILTLILLFGFAVSVAAEGESIRITYAGANLPEIVVNAQTDNMDIDCQDVTLNFDGKTVNASSAEKYDKSKHSRRVFFLLDLSTSMRAKYFTSAKECIADFADNMGENTTVYLITFGKDVSCVLDGSNDAGEIKSVLSTLSNNQGGTKFFAAIKQAMDISDTCPMADMEYAVVFSDGEDFQTGDTTQKEVEDKIGKSAMPIYAMRAETGRVSASDIGIFRSLVAESHGKMYSYSTENAVEVFDDLNSETASQYIIHADTGSNVFNGLSQLLYLKVNGIQSEQISFAAKSKTDITAPEIISEPVISKKDNTITFEISEDIINSANVSPTKDDFSLYTKKGKNVEISDVIYEKTDNGYLLTVCPKKKIVKCEYRLICKDITDNSIEKNPLPQTYVFKSNVGISAFSAFIRNYWYAFIIALTVILLIVIMLVMMKRRNVKSIKELFINSDKNDIEIKHFVNDKTEGRPLRLTVISANNVAKTIDMSIKGSAVFGRANICDVVFDDMKMSRQHFCIGEENGHFVLNDLETTNGTYLNGVMVKAPQLLKNGDKIFAGLSTITIEFKE